MPSQPKLESGLAMLTVNTSRGLFLVNLKMFPDVVVVQVFKASCKGRVDVAVKIIDPLAGLDMKALFHQEVRY